MRHRLQIVVMLLAALSASAIAGAQTVSEQLENGTYTEQTVGDLDAAIQIYKKVLASAEAKDDQKAQAQFRLGMCYFKKRQEEPARQAFQTVVEKYADQQALVAQARARLAGLTAPNPAALMPPEVMLYVEMGSPGVQVEKIANLLKGTPLANPLEAMGKGRQPATRGAATRPSGDEGKTPADIVAALLNPSMMEEFKKVRGLAFGLTGLPPRGGGSVPMVAVVYPGQSDALKGLITAGLLMAGRQAEPIEGMQVVTIESGGEAVAAAYDENVYIVADSLEQLKWCIRQHKGLTKNPSLATANKSFAEMTTPEARRKDAITLWADPAALFKAARPQFAGGGRMPSEIAIASAMLDVANAQGAVLRVVIDEKDPYVEAAVAWKEGHQAVGYDLIRTPALSKTGFEAVPLDAVGVVSIALGEAGEGDAKARAAGQAVQRLTGLDIGRELFANIEQVNLFLMPPTDAATNSLLARKTAPFVPCLGLALTSRDPQKTYKLLDDILSLPRTMAQVEAGQGAAAPRPAKPGEYLLPLGAGVPIYIAQAGRSTILAVDPSVLNAAVSAVKAGKDELAKSPLRAELDRLPAGVCKAVVANAGKAVQAFMSMKMAGAPPQARTQPAAVTQMRMFNRMAEVLSGTSLVFQTTEEPNRLSARLGVVNLPPLAELFATLGLTHGQVEVKASAK